MSSSDLIFDRMIAHVQGLEQKSLGLKEIVSVLQSMYSDIEIPSEALSSLAEDPHHPYSRKILINHPNLEMMIARWTPNYSCAPHDHGDSHSAILVLDGCSEHKSYRIIDGELVCLDTEYKTKGELITCPPKQIHSMKGHPNLITLHLYTNSIDDMLVYDVDHPKTFLVDGGCGAWLPDSDDGVLAKAEGYVHRESLPQDIP